MCTLYNLHMNGWCATNSDRRPQHTVALHSGHRGFAKLLVQCASLPSPDDHHAETTNRVLNHYFSIMNGAQMEQTCRWCMAMQTSYILSAYHRVSVVSSGWKAVASSTPLRTATTTSSRPCAACVASYAGLWMIQDAPCFVNARHKAMILPGTWARSRCAVLCRQCGQYAGSTRSWKTPGQHRSKQSKQPAIPSLRQSTCTLPAPRHPLPPA